MKWWMKKVLLLAASPKDGLRPLAELRTISKGNWGTLPYHFVGPIPNGAVNQSRQFAANDSTLTRDWLMKWWMKNVFLLAASSKDGLRPLTELRTIFKGNWGTLPYHFVGPIPNGAVNQSRQFAANDSTLTRDWLVKLWLAEKKSRRNKRFVPTTGKRWSSHASVKAKPSQESPPLSQSATGFLQPASPQEHKVAPLLARSNLLITRDIEWANLVLGFEQENRYAVVDAYYPEAPVGFISEQSDVIARQILRTRRPFIAKITDSMGNELFRVRRPFWWITSTIFAEIDGKEVGVVHRRWHLWKRVYDLYLGNKQFAMVENPGFWNWTFTLKDIDGKVLAEVDRDWRGFGFELLTDAGQYVIRFGDVNPGSKTGPAKMIKDLEIGRPLKLSERAVAVALAVSLDNDYFSRHGGWGIPFFMVIE